jgi:hypothetical protein
MRKTFSVVVIAAMLIFLANFAFAAEEQKEGWKPFAEISAAVHSAYIDEYSGAATFEKTLFSQSITAGMDKNGIGFYVQGQNFSPSEQEARETDLYAGVYVEKFGMKLDAGYARYWVREKGNIDYNGIYASVDLPAIWWKVVPFVKAEYRFAEKIINEDGAKVSMDGLLYLGGLKREFKLHERLSLMAEVSLGGNSGIYGMPAESLAYTREKLEATFSITEWLKLKASAMTQQNLGKRDGIANDTEKLFGSFAVVMTF